jgi:site-specific DNA-methyltransferase (adenine-specific)
VPESRGIPYFQHNDIVIWNDDILTTSLVERESVDLIVTSPPYNINVEYGTHNDSMTYPDYLNFSRKWMARCLTLSRDDGRFCLNIPLDKNKGGQQSVCADLTTIAKEVGWKYHSTVIWNEQNISRRTAWGSWMSASAPYVIAPVEVVVVLYKKQWRKTSGSGHSDISSQQFQSWTSGVWSFNGESKKKIGHPAPFPIELPMRCIKLFTYIGDTVLDPFLGSGTTLVACANAYRRGIGVDIDPTYCSMAKERVIREGRIYQHRLSPIGGHDEEESNT